MIVIVICQSAESVDGAPVRSLKLMEKIYP